MSDVASPVILGLGLATPEGRIGQADAARFACDLARLGGDERDRAMRLHERAGIESRASVLISPGDPGMLPFYGGVLASGPPSTGERMRAFAAHASLLAARAARDALAGSGVPPGAITHLVTASCTGFASPGFDADLIDQLGLPRCVQRTHIGFMGCHAAINALRVARAMTIADTGANVLLVCAELCSLHFDSSGRTDAMVANALFADGAGACVMRRGSAGARAAHRIRATGSLLIAGTQDAMTWSISDHGFVMTLSPNIPQLIEGSLPGWLGEFLGAHDLRIGDIGGWVVHPGGPRVLSAVERCLALPHGSLDHSRHILRTHGNMSSPTLLFILDRVLRDRASSTARSAGGPIVLLAFGPGLTIEAAIVG